MSYDPYKIDLVVYTDGACLGNGRPGARGGWGVYFGETDDRSCFGRLHGSVQTNQRAELEAIYQALVVLRDSLIECADKIGCRYSNCGHVFRHSILIKTDSRYSIDCLTRWSGKWRRNGWTNAMGNPVANADLIQEILELMDTCGSDIYYEYVPGHLDIPGNIAAHNLAQRGARS